VFFISPFASIKIPFAIGVIPFHGLVFNRTVLAARLSRVFRCPLIARLIGLSEQRC
jgi:hypothetical protein